MDAGPEFLLRQAALLEKFVHQFVVGFRNMLDEFAVQVLHLRLPFAAGRFLRVFAAGIRVVGHHVVAQHIQHAAETGTGIDGDRQRKHMPTKPFPRLTQHGVKIHVLLVHGIDHNHLRDAVMRRVIPHPLRAHAEAVLGVNDHQREIADAQRAQPLADEIEIARRVDDVELLPRPFRVQQGRRD